MSTLTKEWLLKTIAELEGERDAVPGAVNEDAANALAAMKLAMASLEAEPVCVIDQANLDYLKSGSDADVWPASRIEMGDVLLYRAAMLQGADGTLTNEGTTPVTQFKPVADLYGLTSPTGGETSFTFDAVEARDFIDGGWSCQEYVELGRFQEAMLQNGNSPAQSDCCPEQNYIAPAQDGDSPVIPDGWVLVPEEPTHEMLEAGDEQFGTYDVYRRMIAASPQQK
ncbi:TPA: hypothetical protein ACW7JL_003796 [Enterobacter hormaechei]|uniref:hypothetical protein n=1 Tax=Enterobacter hormaechei TaxID=158836 RepID=UPI00079991A7|nr:hypothetical protein [Enterobacter hormaechei]MCE1311002.1 hypothetical protein [Enterobacter hormaechei]MDV0435538.1 hypothetical protein [Enterobacter hormaechei]SAC75639.1 Uncharacterised protein [Enterobacter hormaechei]HCJ6423346.1 hypothetical protein [Enterobacter hormaechei subsp. xiangfangensis]